MGTNLNFKSYVSDPPGDGGGRPAAAELPLARQTSIYSLTFDELQSTMGGVGKDFGSMNMDELLRNIWGAEETQGMAAPPHDGGSDGSVGHLQRQGSVTLPRTLSTKTVDEVWRDISNVVVGKDCVGGGSNEPQRQQTLGEMTLEEFLVRAGVVREDAQVQGAAFFGPSNNNGSGIGFQQMGSSIGFMGGNPNLNLNLNSNQISLQSPNLPLNVNGVRSNPQQLQQIFPKSPYAAQMPLSSGGAQLGSPGMRGGIAGMASPGMNGGGVGMMGLGAGVVTSSPGNQISSDGIGRSNGDISSVSPVPYVFNGGLRGRRSGTVEKVVERRQRRMIKNRESAARSRARKQAYTMELEAEVAKLKEDNEGLRKKQEKILEMQKNQVLEMMNMQRGGKKQCLRRTQTGPW